METEHIYNALNFHETTAIGDEVSSTQGDLRTNRPSFDPDMSSESMPDEVFRHPKIAPYIYRRDVVRSNASGRIGIVTKVAGDLDSDSSITDVDDEDDDEADANEECGAHGSGSANSRDDSIDKNTFPADEVRVLWIDDSETTQSINDVTVVDRGFLYGDYVAAASDPIGQVGIVVDVDISVDLLTPDGSILKNISSRDLKRVRDLTVGDYVVLGPWLGRIDDVSDNVTVLFDDGSVCKVTKADPLHLRPVGKNILEDGHFPYYPGQRVKASSSSIFKNSRWLSGLWKPNRLEGTVTKVTVGSVFIYWIASAGYGPDSSTTPAEEQSPRKLKLLSCFAHANWQLGDWCLLISSMLLSSIPLDKGLSKLELCGSTKAELEFAQTKPAYSGLITLDESNDNSEIMDIDAGAATDDNVDYMENNASMECSSCSASLSVSKEPVHETWPLHRKKIRKVVVKGEKKARNKVENFEKAFLIFNIKTRVDIAWQDGRIEHGQDSTVLIPIDRPGDHEFVAEQYVVEKATDESADSVEARHVGVLRSVNAKEKTACVRWLKPASRLEDPREFDEEEVVSVYELEGHPDYDYCYGDVVVRLLPVSVMTEMDNCGSSVEVSKQFTYPNESEQDFEKQSCSKKVKGMPASEACSEFSDLSWVGNITGLRDGDIEVTWADGMISTVGPQAIFVVGRDDDESIALGSEASDDAASWETVEDDEMNISENANEDLRQQSLTDVSPVTEDSTMVAQNSRRNGALSILGFVSRLATGIFSRGRKHMDPLSLDSGAENELQSEGIIDSPPRRDFGDESSSQKSNGSDNCGALSTRDKGEQPVSIEANDLLEVAEACCSLMPQEPIAPGPPSNGTSSFNVFDIAKDPYDHYFLSVNGQNNAGRKWLKKVQQDWNILQNNLPEGIYVRVYEDRMDFLRAVVVGAYGTPYQDGLFFFDFHLPAEYPDVPPSAYYHSGGWRINPNLYEEGKVCLSLLNTWTGRGNEVWDPVSSSILQVLVSLQGLVLNSKPYFNEAGYDKQIGTAEGEKNSLSYNENTFLLNCKTMMYLMRKPPKDFEQLVREHFRRRGYYILKACDAYMKGYLIGSLTTDASLSDKSNANSNSTGFKLMFTKIVPKLFSSLNEVGADCQEFKHLQQS